MPTGYSDFKMIRYAVLILLGFCSCFCCASNTTRVPGNTNHSVLLKVTVSDNTSSGLEYYYSYNGEYGGGEGAEEGEGMSLASWNFNFVALPLTVSLFVIFAALVKLAFFYTPHLSTYIPESCALIAVGVVVGAILYFGAKVPETFKLDYSTFMLFLLPPIVLESAYSLNNQAFSDNIGVILIYAVIGTVLNFLIIGFSLYGMDTVGAMGLSASIQLTLLEFLLFASFIVAVDPVAVLAIFQDIGVNKTLYFLVFGESLLNDAVTIVLYDMMKAFNAAPNVQIGEIFLGIGSFFTVSLGGLAIGIVLGIISSLLTRITGRVKVLEPMGILIIAYLSYLCAALVNWSGIISLIGCGIVQAQYAFHNISKNSHIMVHYFIKMLSSISDCIIFLFLGLELLRTQHFWNPGFMLWSLFFCLIARVVSSFGLTFFINLHHKVHRISVKEQLVMWYGGLRGAICFALCTTVVARPQVKNLFLTTTFLVIIFTVFIQGITMGPLVKYCKILMDREEPKELLIELQNLVTNNTITCIEVIIDHRRLNLHTWFYGMNENYFKRWMLKKPKSDREEFLERYKEAALANYEEDLHKGHKPTGVPSIAVNGTTEDGMSSLNNSKANGLDVEVMFEPYARRPSENMRTEDIRRMLLEAGQGSQGSGNWTHDRDIRYHDVPEVMPLPKYIFNDSRRPSLDTHSIGNMSTGYNARRASSVTQDTYMSKPRKNSHDSVRKLEMLDEVEKENGSANGNYKMAKKEAEKHGAFINKSMHDEKPKATSHHHQNPNNETKF